MSNLLHLLDDESARFDPLLTPNFTWWFDDNDAVADGVDPTKLGYVPNKLGGNMRKGGNTSGQPDINTRTLNDRKVANFIRVSGSSGNYCFTQNFPNFTNTGNYTVITLVEMDLPSQDGQMGFVGHQGGSANFNFSITNFGGTKLNFSFGSPTTSFSIPWTPVAGPHIFVHRREGTLLEGFIDGVLYGTNNTGANVNMSNSFGYGREEAVGGRSYWDGSFPEQRGFTGRALTRQEINDHCNDIKKTWGNSVPWTNIS